MIYETYSQRQAKLAKSGQADVYNYDDFPKEFRTQVAHIWDSLLGTDAMSPILWDDLHDTFARQIGVFSLHQAVGTTHYANDKSRDQCRTFILKADTAGVLDIIDYSVYWITNRLSSIAAPYISLRNAKRPSVADAVNELNYRFRQNGLGFVYEKNQIIRIDSQFVHAESVVPALRLLSDPAFSTADEEFREAHKKYRAGDYKGAVVAAENAFESTIKVICHQRGWSLTTGATATELVKTIWDNKLIPNHLDDQKEGLRSMLRGLSVIRNKCGAAHGAGATAVDVPEHVASYCLHMSAATILFLVQQHQTMP